jgi:RNA polymerase sigma factor (sigma-70 family)
MSTWIGFTEAMQLNDLERQVYCKQFIETLEPRLQLVALRRYYQNQSLSSIAEELGISYSRAYQLELKIIGKLIKQFRKEHM